MKPIYEPKTKAKEYGEYAINIYTGCSHGCTYCYAAKMAKRFGNDFTKVEPRKDIVNEVVKQLERENITEKLIHLCFTCDPYPLGVDSIATRQIIQALKATKNHVQILTKNGIGATRDLDLFDKNDWIGVTYAGYNTSPVIPPQQEPNAGWVIDRFRLLVLAKQQGIKTWVSCEPVLNTEKIYKIIETGEYIDLFKIGKLNHYPSDINWGEFGRKCEELCQKHNRNYYIKEDLRRAMEDKANDKD